MKKYQRDYPGLTLEILEEAISKLPPVSYPKRVRVSYGDYRRLREACAAFKICPEQPEGYTLGFCGEMIIADVEIADNHYEVDW